MRGSPAGATHKENSELKRWGSPMLRIPDRTNEIIYVFEDNSDFAISHFRNSPSAFRHSPFAISLLVFAQKPGQAQGPAPTSERMAMEIEMKVFV
jgi:hypothetical protein